MRRIGDLPPGSAGSATIDQVMRRALARKDRQGLGFGGAGVNAHPDTSGPAGVAHRLPAGQQGSGRLARLNR